MGNKVDDILDQIQDRGVYELEGIDPETVASAKRDLCALLLHTVDMEFDYGKSPYEIQTDIHKALSELFNKEV